MEWSHNPIVDHLKRTFMELQIGVNMSSDDCSMCTNMVRCWFNVTENILRYYINADSYIKYSVRFHAKISSSTVSIDPILVIVAGGS